MSSKNKNHLGKGFRKANLGPSRPTKKCAKMAARIRSIGSRKTPEERQELQKDFMKRISLA